MTVMPFICLAAGFAISYRELPEKVLKLIDWIINVVLVVLMSTIGLNIGINDSVMKNLVSIGFNCAAISLLAIALSVVFIVIIEKTVLPLGKIQQRLSENSMSSDQPQLQAASDSGQTPPDEKKSSLIFIMPISILLGIGVGFLAFPKSWSFLLDFSLFLSLVLLYTGVGISLGTNRKVFRFIKILGVKIILVSIGIFLGSLCAGFLASPILGIPPYISVISASGMSYYSITGAYMTSAFGIEAGTYGFIVNVMREFFTVLLIPILIKISKGSPIASGAAGGMDTMLMPITKFVGPELGLVTLITGTILTFAVPIVLPLLHSILTL